MAREYHAIYLRISREEREQVKQRAKEARLSVNQFVRRQLGLPAYRFITRRSAIPIDENEDKQ